MTRNKSLDKKGVNYGRRGRCHSCGDHYDNISVHWARNDDCSHPPISNYKLEIIKGSMMGDANLEYHKGGKNPRVTISNTNKEYIQYLENVLGWLKKSVDSKSGSFGNEKLYRLHTLSHPELKRFDWYEDGDKRYPDRLNITPLSMKHWFCQDGGLEWHKKRSNVYAKLYTKNENDRLGWLCDKITKLGLEPYPSRDSIKFTTRDTKIFLDIIAPSPLGMEYKWEVYDYDKYQQKKR